MVYWRCCGGRRGLRFIRQARQRLCLNAGVWRVRRPVRPLARFRRRPLRGLSARQKHAPA
ncbi:MAG: hypothetical protein JXN59_13970 [Anaerolineae bacterium]|nr:hypothetical protein [Anaerolineae bacterium]